MVNPRVFMDITIGGNSAGRIVIELFADTTPNSAEKFRVLCTGEKGTDLHYKGSTFNYVGIATSVCQGGEVKAKSKSMESVNDLVNFHPDKLIKKHDGPGTVSMLGPTGSEFFITTKCLPSHDGLYVVFGKVVEGITVVNAMWNLRSSSGIPTSPIVIADCGELRELAPSFVEFDQLASTSNKQLTICLKEIMNVSNQLALDPKDGRIPENECDLVETAEIFQRNLDVVSDLKAEVCLLEKRQNELLSFTRTEISVARKRKSVLEMIPCLSYDDLVNIEDVINKRKREMGNLMVLRNPRVYMDITIDDNPVGRIIIELFADTAPCSAATFRSLCTGNNPGRLHYKGNDFWHVSPTVLKGGTLGSEQDRESVFGINPQHENIIHKHNGFGVVSMLSPSSPQFAIALTGFSEYDDNDNSAQVVVGKVVEGLNVVKAIRNTPRFSRAVITDCGELSPE